MNTNHILKRAISQIKDYDQKAILIGNLAVNIQYVKPTLVKRCNFTKRGVHIFIDHHFNILQYINTMGFLNSKLHRGWEIKLLKEHSQYILFIKEEDRNYIKYNHYKYGTRSIDKSPHSDLNDRLRRYKESKYKNTPHHEIMYYAHHIIQHISNILLHDIDDQHSGDVFFNDFIELWNNYKYCYSEICKGNENNIDRYLYYKVSIIIFYQSLKKGHNDVLI